MNFNNNSNKEAGFLGSVQDGFYSVGSSLSHVAVPLLDCVQLYSNPMDYSTPGILPELTQLHVHDVLLNTYRSTGKVWAIGLSLFVLL